MHNKKIFLQCTEGPSLTTTSLIISDRIIFILYQLSVSLSNLPNYFLTLRRAANSTVACTFCACMRCNKRLALHENRK